MTHISNVFDIGYLHPQPVTKIPEEYRRVYMSQGKTAAIDYLVSLNMPKVQLQQLMKDIVEGKL